MNRCLRHIWTRRVITLGMLFPAPGFTQTEAPSFQHSFTGQLLFWSVGFVIVALMARVIFKEQLHERRTLKRMVNELGIFYPEFDIDAIKHWVNRCAPHLWSGWARDNVAGLATFSTDSFLADETEAIEALTAAGHVRHAMLNRVLKIHPLGLYMVGPGPAPRDVELMLRLEIKGVEYIETADGRLVDGVKDERQIQHFWTMTHDGHQWRLSRVWPATYDANDLAEREQVPPVKEWVRPELDSNDQVQR